jgi:hypothetical protein
MFSFFTEAIEAGAGNGVVSGVFVPLADLPGMTLAELATTGTTAEGHAVYSVLNSLYSALAPLPSLGIINLQKSSPVGTGPDRYTEGVTATFQYLIDLQDKTVSPLPLPTIGLAAGIGAFYLEDIWPGAAIIANQGAISGAGLLIPDSLISQLGGVTPGAIDVDCRDWIAALFGGMVKNATLRTASVPSAIVTRTNPTTNRLTGVAIPPAWYDAVDPVTGIVGADLGYLRVVQETLLIEYEIVSDPDTQTLALSIRTS